MGVSFLETSAKTGENVTAVENLATSVLGYMLTCYRIVNLTLAFALLRIHAFGDGAGPKPQYIPSEITLSLLGIKKGCRAPNKEPSQKLHRKKALAYEYALLTAYFSIGSAGGELASKKNYPFVLSESMGV